MNKEERESESYLKGLIEIWVHCLFLDSCLPLGVLAGVRKEVGLDVGVRESITVSRSQISRSVHMDQEFSRFVEEPELDVS